MNDQRWVVTRVEKCERATFRIELGVKEGDEPIRRNAFDQIAVDGADRLYQRAVIIGLRVDGCMQRRHQQRGSGTFSGNISEGHDQLAVLALDKIVIVAADLVTRKADALQFITGNLRRRSRLKPLLNLAGDLQLAFEALALQLLFCQTRILNANG